MKTIEILSEMNIHFDEATDSLFDYILGCKKITTLDMFPKVIHNSRKYQSVEVFYQRVLDRNMKKREFINIEKRFIDFVISLWLYNETYVDICSSEIFNNYYYKRNKKILKKNSIVNLKSIAGTDEFLLIKDKDVLGSACIIATRDISPVVFYFRNSKILFLLNGCTGLLYYGFPKDILFTKRVANNCSLYLHKAEVNK